MWKRMCAFVCMAALALSLAGCAGGQSGAENSSSAQQNGLSSLFGQNTASKEEKEPEKVTLTYTAPEGEQHVEAAIYTGTGYTIAIPTDWVRAEYAVRWHPVNQEEVSLSVRCYADTKAEDAAEAFRTENEAYDPSQPVVFTGISLSETLGDALMVYGTDEEGNALSALFLHPAEDTEKDENKTMNKSQNKKQGCYAIVMRCTEAALEDYGDCLNAMVGTFTLTKAETMTMADNAQQH